MLISAKYKLPKKLLVHGYLNIGGKKMSKSIGNVIDPLQLLEKYPSDVVRYSLLRCSVFDDSDYSEEILIERNNNELANKLGNLISRVSTLAEKYGMQKTEIKHLKSKHLQNKISNLMEEFEFDKALNEIFSFIDECNEFIQKQKPWETHDKKVLYEIANAIKDFTILLSPFIPETSDKISKTFGFEISIKSLKSPLKIKKIIKSDILFKKIDLEVKPNEESELPANNKALNNKPPKNEKVNKSTKIEGIMSTIEYKDWEKLDLRVGKIEKVEDIEGADKLYKLTINIGSETRVVCAGLKKHYSAKELLGKKVIVFVNLAPRTMKGIESKGMLLAAVSDDESQVILISPEKDIKPGSKIR
jgi:methionyl-tRNA synthetase